MTYVPAQRFHLYEKQCGNEWVSEVGGSGGGGASENDTEMPWN